MNWHITRNPRMVAWDIVLVLAIVLSIAFVVTRTNTTWLSNTLGIFSLRSSVIQEKLPVSAIDRTDVSDLIVALKDPMTGVRINAVQALGAKHASNATDALLAATYDSDARVREEAAAALGDVNAIQALPRLKELQVVAHNTLIEMAAFEAEGRITRNIGAALGVSRSSVKAVTVAQNGRAYAATSHEFYALQDGKWQRTSYLSAVANNLSASPDGQLIYMSSDSSGLYRSRSGGNTWEHVQYGSDTPTQLQTTAVLVNPKNTDEVFVALAVNSQNTNGLDSVGITVSRDNGKTWMLLPDSPFASVTRSLIIDRTNYHILYGMSDVEPWSYQLAFDEASSN